MKRTHISLLSFAVTMLLAPAAYGQATRTWVSGVGDDVNPCSRTAPCKTFAGAISKTFINGEINVIDPGAYGAVTITKSITINADENMAGILAGGINGIIINIPAGNVNDPRRRVHLRNLKIDGTGASGAVGTSTGISAIRIDAASEVVIENCLIQNFTQFGVNVNSTAGVQVTIGDSTITDTTLSAVRTIVGGPLTRLAMRNVLVQRTGFGVDVSSAIATIENSMISGVTQQAIVAQGGGTINVNGGVVYNNGVGVATTGAGSTVRIANLGIYNNTTGISVGAGGTVASFGGNKNAGNVTPGAPNFNIPLQ